MKFLNKIILGDSMQILPRVENNSIDLVLTDPPYFLDKMDNNWKHETVSKLTDYCRTIKSPHPELNHCVFASI